LLICLTREVRIGVTEKYTKKVSNAMQKAHAAIKIMLKRLKDRLEEAEAALIVAKYLVSLST